MKAIDYAVLAIETMMRKYNGADLPPKNVFFYHQGVFLSGVLKIYELTNDERFFNYAKDWIDSVFDGEGKAKGIEYGGLDYTQPGILLYPIYDKTHNEKYKKYMDYVIGEYTACPRCKNGGLYHRTNLIGEMWLDGIYMIGPFVAEYGKRFSHPEYIHDIAREIKLMREVTRDDETGLWYHAWDESHMAPWADKITGHSHEFWGRSIAWVPVGILDVLDEMDSGKEKDEITDILVDLLKSVGKYQSEDGRWYQVIDKGSSEGNWLENSCSSLFAAAMAKAVTKGILGREYADKAITAYKGVIKSLTLTENGDIEIGAVCIGTSVGDYDFYIHRPTSVNDLHGVGAFLLMCAEISKLSL